MHGRPRTAALATHPVPALRPVRATFTLRRHIDLARVASAACR
ncbi:putative leader peptide [Streptomyces formicae]